MSAAHPGPATFLVLAALASTLLTGCDAIQKARELGREFANPTKFGTPTRDVLEKGPKGTKVRLMVESTAAASWLDATMAIGMSVPEYCIDGESFHYESETPEGMLGGPEAFEREHPAGTTFTAVVHCSPPPPYEFALEAGTSEEDASKKVTELLQGAAKPDLERFQVRIVPYNDRQRKYAAIEGMAGSILGSGMARCPDGLIVNRMIVAAHPRPDPQDRVFLNRSFVVLGVDASCRASTSPQT